MKKTLLTGLFLLAALPFLLAQFHNPNVFVINGMHIDASNNPRLAAVLRPLVLNGRFTTTPEKSVNETKSALVKIEEAFQDFSGETVGFNILEFSYDEAGRLIKLLVSFEFEDEELEPIFSFESTYNDMGLNETNITYSFDPQGGQIPEMKSQIYYDANNLVNLVEEFSYNGASQTWTLISKTDNFTYYTPDSVLTFTVYERDTIASLWLLERKITNVYESPDFKIRTLQETFDVETQSWSNDNRRTLYEYTTSPKFVTLLEIWDSMENSWILDFKTEEYFDANGKKNKIIQQYPSPDLPPNNWSSGKKEERTFDADGNQITSLVTFWNEQTQDWEETVIKRDLVYDNAVPLADLILPIFEMPSVSDGYFQRKLLSTLFVEIFETDTIPISNTTYYYEDIVLSNQTELEIPSLVVYPNPAQTSIRFQGLNASETLQFVLFDALGRQLLFEEVQSSTILSVQHLTEGLYYYTVTNAGVSQTGKMSIQR